MQVTNKNSNFLQDAPPNSRLKSRGCGGVFLKDLRENPNNFSFWYPAVKKLLRTPDSIIIPVPDEIIRSFFMERDGDGERVREFIRTTVIPAIPKEFGPRVFLKNGCFSDKFVFRYCMPEVTPESLYESITRINMDSLCFDTGGNAEIVIRRLVGQKDTTFKDTIYEGMRLRPEVRVFHDFDSGRSLYAANYWDWDYCHDAISRDPDDGAVYEKVYPTLKSIFDAQQDYLLELVESRFKGASLKGIWSVDLMYAENTWWLIDMAVGHLSAYWDPERVKHILDNK